MCANAGRGWRCRWDPPVSCLLVTFPEVKQHFTGQSRRDRVAWETVRTHLLGILIKITASLKDD